ncbi:MAG TPA: hypothetical protein VMG59_08485 [Phycisphaerae bacterium]|nr:hypothetical protein [Phycisphaerae bacterium]
MSDGSNNTTAVDNQFTNADNQLLNQDNTQVDNLNNSIDSTDTLNNGTAVTNQVTSTNNQAVNQNETLLQDIENLFNNTVSGITSIGSQPQDTSHNLTLNNPHSYTVIVLIDDIVANGLTPGQTITLHLPPGQYRIEYIGVKVQSTDNFIAQTGSSVNKP